MIRRLERSAGLKKILSIIKILLLLTLVPALACCGKDGSNNGDEDIQETSISTTDNTAPVVYITSPTSKSSYTSSSTPLTVSGTASDSGGISSVTWSSSSGENGACTGKASWTASVPLTSGTNKITITAEDSAGNTGSDTLDATYTTTATVILSGTITVPSTNMVDNDVNDENQSYTTNNSIDNAQSIFNPVTLGGYVNNSYDLWDVDSGDIDDYFCVSLSEGDSISLSISDYNSDSKHSVDLDLYVFDDEGNVVASSVGDNGTELIADFPYSGVYYIDVHAGEGAASNYVLSIGDHAGSSTTALGTLSSDRDFVPGQVIIRFKDGTSGITTRKMMSDHISSMGMGMKAGRPGKEALASIDISKKDVTFKNLDIPDDRASLTAVDKKTQNKLNTLLIIKALRTRSDVESADPNYILHPLAVPNDKYYSYQWNLPLINLPDAWDTTTGDSSVIVAVVDTGVLLDHPDLNGRLTDDGYDFISDTSVSNDGNGIDNGPDDPGDEDNSDGTSSFHGTHVAGIIAAATNNNTGIAGIGWSTMIMPVRVLGIGGGTTYDALQGVRYAAGLYNDSGLVPDTPADVINLSWGSDTYSETEANVYEEVREAGVIAIAAAGNDSSTKKFYPASYDSVVSVGAVDINGDRASYSNYGSDIDVAAPGGDSGDLNGDGYPDYVLSACGDDSTGSVIYDYVFMAGTSMASPHVAGVVALMKAIKPAMTPDELDQYLESGEITDDIDDTETYGYGLIDAYRAVMAAGGAAPSVIKVSPSNLYMGQSATSAVLTVSQLGSETVTVTDVSDNADWLTVSADEADENGLGTYSILVNKDGLLSGNYSAEIIFISDSNTVSIPVKMQVGSGVTQDAGYHYVLLVDPDTNMTISYTGVEAEDGAYNYTLEDVPQGTYEIYAGSNRDGDRYLGDAGESFGAYKSTDQPIEIAVDQDISGLDFTVDYIVNLSTALESAEGYNSLLLIQTKK